MNEASSWLTRTLFSYKLWLMRQRYGEGRAVPAHITPLVHNGRRISKCDHTAREQTLSRIGVTIVVAVRSDTDAYARYLMERSCQWLRRIPSNDLRPCNSVSVSIEKWTQSDRINPHEAVSPSI